MTRKLNPVPDDKSFDEDRLMRTLAIMDAKAWRPKAGDILTAKLVKVRRGGENSEYGTYPVLVFERIPGYPFPLDDDNTHDSNYVAFHAFHTIPLNALAELRPNPSERPVMTIKSGGRVQFGETVKNKDGDDVYVEKEGKADYEDYTILMGDGTDIPETEFDWDADVKKRG